MDQGTIFDRYHLEKSFFDRFKEDGEEGVDVIMPIFNTNELWGKNLQSFYREIPINRLIIGDGGCTDDSIEIANQFPRVKIIDQSNRNSLGYCIKELIKNVETEWFIYLHADVYLPGDWYDNMVKYQNKYDWFECYRKMTILVEYWAQAENKAVRAYSGSQMGRKKAFKDVLPKIDDDYLYRNEDIIFRGLIEAAGFKYARISDTFHYHQVMNKKGENEPKFKKVMIEKERDEKWEKRTYDMQARGIIKYLQPKKHLIESVNSSIAKLSNLGVLNWPEFKKWVKKTNPVWLKYIRKKGSWKYRMTQFALKNYRKFG